MGEKIHLLMAIHCHQPVGNFDGVFAHGYEVSYKVFLDVLERHPKIKLALHYTGPLLEWLEQRHPEFLDRIRDFVERGQVEILSGGFYEPILTLLPHRDAIGQINLLTDYVKNRFGYLPKGAWLAERIWEPKVPYILNQAGLKFTIVDDSHFAVIGRDVESLDGYYVSEDEGKTVFVFPTSEKLRYYMPFKLPEETIKYLRGKLDQGFKALTFGDDGEKFGMWPGTYKWVYQEGWLDKFFSAIESCEWIETVTFSEYISKFPPSGTVYLPCVSYREMIEWSGGYFRNFLIKYPESNRMHKRMLLVSSKLSESRDNSVEKRYLYKAQCNCGYWHGVFGGLYLNHLRSAVFSNLILAEVVSGKFEDNCSLDYDLDGRKEWIFSSDDQKIFLSDLGNILEWDLKEKAVNISNVLTRRYEPYHEKLKNISSTENNSAEVVSIHDLTMSHVKDLSVLKYDKYIRSSLIDYWARDCSPEHFFAHEHLRSDLGAVEQVSEEDGAVVFRRRFWVDNSFPVWVEKRVFLSGRSLFCDIKISSESKGTGFYCMEFNYSMFDETFSSGKGIKEETKEIWFKDKWYGINILHTADRPFRIVHYPVETVSDSEHGIETTFQGSCLVLLWQVNLEMDTLHLVLEISKAVE